MRVCVCAHACLLACACVRALGLDGGLHNDTGVSLLELRLKSAVVALELIAKLTGDCSLRVLLDGYTVT